MSDSSTPARPNEGGGYDLARFLPQRSFGLKLILVCVLALMMAIPAGFVWVLVYARTTDAEAAISEVAALRGGPQTLMGPAIVVPYDRDIIVQNNGVNQVQTQQGRMVLYAETGSADATLKTETLKRGLHSVPTFMTDASFKATFDPAKLTSEAPTGARLHWNEAKAFLSMGDLRGAKDVRLTLGDKALEVAPVEGQSPGVYPVNPSLPSTRALIAAPLGWTEAPPAGPISAEAFLRISGAERVALAAFARDTTITMSGNWASPSFDGGVLPDQRSVTRDGFTASWRVPFLARGAPGVGPDLSFDTVINASPGATLLDTGNPYQSVVRALKYAPMFIGLVFLTYFLFETTSGIRAHPAQYVLVGLAQTVFYMLLLSISEVLGFNLGFLAAAAGTVLMLSLYAGSVFGSHAAMLKALVVFSALYGLIYVLLRQEDYALLVGSIASFAAIAGTMWMTRKLDWYGAARAAAAPRTQPPAPAV